MYNKCSKWTSIFSRLLLNVNNKFYIYIIYWFFVGFLMSILFSFPSKLKVTRLLASVVLFCARFSISTKLFIFWKIFRPGDFGGFTKFCVNQYFQFKSQIKSSPDIYFKTCLPELLASLRNNRKATVIYLALISF